MTIEKNKDNENFTIKLEGRLDTSTAPELEKVINEEVDGMKHLVLDLEKLEYISSAGLRVLLAAQKRMNKAGDMKVTGVCPAVMEVFSITGFEDVLTIE